MDNVKSNNIPIVENGNGLFLFDSFSKKQKAFFCSKLVYKQKIINKQLLKKFRFTPYLLYGVINNSDDIHLSQVVLHPRGNLTVACKDNSDFSAAIKGELRDYKPVSILLSYERLLKNEADEFIYPISFDVPAFSFTNVYKKRKFSKKPKIITYIDGPFYASSSLSLSEQKKQLREQVLECILERSQLTDNEFKDYKRTGENKNV